MLEELDRAGVKKRDIFLLGANALHRKFTRRELAKVIGKNLVEEFGYRLFCHDAEDPQNLSYLGTTVSGCDVEVNRLVTDSNLTVYPNTVVWRGFNGGWKSICVGLSTYRSIRWHHSPEGMFMSLERNPMHEMLNEMGARLEEELGERRIFKIETVLANPLQVAHVWYGILVTYPLKRLRHARRFFVAGAEKPSLAAHLGLEPKDTVEAAIAEAEEIHGKDASIVFIRNPLIGSRQ